MKPLAIMVTYNRLQETQATLESLAETVNIDRDLDLAIWDNASEDGTWDFLRAWVQDFESVQQGGLHFSDTNIGCPRALNRVIYQHRKPGQPVLKIDNDVRFLKRGWLDDVQGLLSDLARADIDVALLSAFYPEIFDNRPKDPLGNREGRMAYQTYPAIGHCLWHTGAFMDRVGYFDVLRDDHIYGFEDLIMSHKARRLGLPIVTWEGWQIENLQRHTSLGRERRDDHVAAMRPLYNRRVRALQQGGSLYTDKAGRPVIHPEERAA